MPVHEATQTSFDFPPRLTVKLFDLYDEQLEKNLEAAQAHAGEERKLTTTRKLAVVFQSALKAGLYLNWQSAVMPDPDTDDIDEQECAIILWAGEAMAVWLSENRKVPKVSFWAWLIMLRARLTKRLGYSPKPKTPGTIRRYRDS